MQFGNSPNNNPINAAANNKGPKKPSAPPGYLPNPIHFTSAPATGGPVLPQAMGHEEKKGRKSNPKLEIAKELRNIRSNYGPGIIVSAYLRGRAYANATKESPSSCPEDRLSGAWKKADLDERVSLIRGLTVKVRKASNHREAVDEVAGELNGSFLKQQWEILSQVNAGRNQNVMEDLKRILGKPPNKTFQFSGAGHRVLMELAALCMHQDVKGPFGHAVFCLPDDVKDMLTCKWDTDINVRLGNLSSDLKDGTWKKAVAPVVRGVLDDLSDASLVRTDDVYNAWLNIGSQRPAVETVIRTAIWNAGSEVEVKSRLSEEELTSERMLRELIITLRSSAEEKYQVLSETWINLVKDMQYNLKIDWLGITDCAAKRLAKGINSYRASFDASSEILTSFTASPRFNHVWTHANEKEQRHYTGVLANLLRDKASK